MAEIRPFRALRFTPEAGDMRELVCPPYDIISESQRLSYLKRNPHNIIRLELPRTGRIPMPKPDEPCGSGWNRASCGRMISQPFTAMKSFSICLA